MSARGRRRYRRRARTPAGRVAAQPEVPAVPAALAMRLEPFAVDDGIVTAGATAACEADGTSSGGDEGSEGVTAAAGAFLTSASMFSSGAPMTAEQLAHGTRVALGRETRAQHAVAARGELHHRLVGLHLREHIALRDRDRPRS